jgi:hypothetical protein
MKAKLFLLILCACIFLLSGCSPAYIKYVTNTETLEITKDYVKSAGGRENIHKEIYVVIVFTEKGRNNFRLMTERNAGKNVSIYFGDKLIRADLYMPKPMDSREMSITMPDEKTMRDVVKSYSGQ